MPHLAANLERDLSSALGSSPTRRPRHKIVGLATHSTIWRTLSVEKYAKRLNMAGRVHAIRNGIVAAALAALSAWPSQAETIDIID